jgi:hypothetical protein
MPSGLSAGLDVAIGNNEQTSREAEVMRMAGVGIAGMAVAGSAVPKARRQGQAASPEGEVHVRRTYGDKRFVQEAP